MSADPTAVLRRSPLLAKLTDEELASLLALTNERFFDDGDLLTKAGSNASLGMWIIIEGTVNVSRDGNVLTTLGPGDHVGEMAIMSNMPRSADVIAVGPVRTLQLARWDLRGLVADHPDIALSIMDAMAARLAAQNAAS